MDELIKKVEELLKSLLSVKTGANKALMVPAIKPPSLKVSKLSIKQPSKIPSALPPPSKKDPIKVAEQLKNPHAGKVNVEVLKVESNGQWSLDKGVLDPSHGINFVHEHHDLGGVGDLTHVKAIHPVHGVVGETVLEHQADGSLKPSDVNVAPLHRRMGIASAMYNHAEKLTNKKIAPSTAQTKLGQALWTGNKTNSQFGSK
jgi:GNAT superfamily N-acetyltransferase